MTNNNQGLNIQYKIGIIGPTRVGKTSIITALLEQGKDLLTGTGVSIEAVGNATKARINGYRDKLRGSLIAEEFNPGGLSGTEEPSRLELTMRVDNSNSKLTWAILDYPGAWVDERFRPPERQKDWEDCLAWIRESIVLLVPIDAAIVMESSTPSEKRAANTTLQISQTGDVAREWVKGRINKKEPGLLILVPVKCETYFSDNGGQRNQSEELLESIQQKYYQDLLSSVHKEINGATNTPQILIQYHPIDTIGCVEIKNTQWTVENNDAVFQANYLVRPPRKFSPKGADGLIITICRQIINLEKNKQRNIVSSLWRWLTKEDKKLQNAIEKLHSKPFSERVKDL
ncbi:MULTISPECIES: hypothetical protein [unclassified Tolypothrix]|uniref:hypothetical protein n=1 Tax=unclassified Tolypothrix TaxID=2649714 RepID=UPI0005EAA8A0|nr:MULTISPECIES: hypothetical protein [unclassified Tolypothrix]BAY89540.1 hypothetical protein NIES3275_15430 [Microchaete diplosiphon NIES-3275]EKF02512.1 hypothetical protein FDUTEX481_06675 [Tolypothrix sp. PCC 7601]MBE9081570.1 hypothetical protein [Tolypothrix sp. LEGE 11397]UYD23823.1 hypothetical protein HGR01_20150 [Tolypothrix sp. PCC 7712]UYD33952.1 hypothetical protein HG267_34605 [Tolypothrix sp. PCC 7601]